MAAPTETRTRRTADERRDEIVTIAIRQFALSGYNGTSTEAIAREAGISQPYLFRLFKTKRELFLACHDAQHARLYETFAAAAAAVEQADAIEAMGKAYVDLLADREMLLLQLHGYAACADPEVRETASRGYAELWQLVARLSGAPEDEVRAFCATGMLLNVAAAMDLPQIAGDPGWALDHLRAQATGS
jgi:AcrR family transcriptional regulator